MNNLQNLLNSIKEDFNSIELKLNSIMGYHITSKAVIPDIEQNGLKGSLLADRHLSKGVVFCYRSLEEARRQAKYYFDDGLEKGSVIIEIKGSQAIDAVNGVTDDNERLILVEDILDWKIL